MDRRNPHQPFDPPLIQGFLSGRELVSAALLTGGKSNSSYKLVLRADDAFVLRLYSSGDAARQTYAMSLVRGLVPVPVELDRGAGWSVFSFLEGELLESVPEHADKTAEVLASIASVSFESQGWIEPDGSITPFSFGGHDGFTDQMLEPPAVLPWIGQEAADETLRIQNSGSRRYGEMDAESRLVHGDFNPMNILIQDGEVSGVLDWEYCHSGSSYMDIGNLLRHTAPAYRHLAEKGLKAGGMALPDDWQERAELADLSSHLEFLTSPLSDDFKRQCVGRIRRFIEKFGQGR